MNSKQIDKLVYQAVFGLEEEKSSAREQIYNRANEIGIISSSINDFYLARGSNNLPHNFTVPAMNIRGMAYDTARAAFKAAVKHNVGALIFELARSEMGYTDQPPMEYATVVRAAAIREGWVGPLFLQCDHFQAKADSPGVPKEGEIKTISDLVKEALNAGFYNVDIDMSTLVDLDKKEEQEQQVGNIKYSVEIAKFIREIEPKGITTSLGGEVGHIGGVNSSVEDVRAYLKGFNQEMGSVKGMSKISVNTGSSHGGVVLADGSLADVDIDFSILKDVSKVCREEFQIGGSVQHGASTLPDEYFSQFTKSEAVEVHLATGFQNIQMDHKEFPSDLISKMYLWLDQTKQDEKKEGQTIEQFHYKLRKKAWGEFKKDTWDILEEKKEKIRSSLANRFEFFYKELNVVDSIDIVKKHVNLVEVSKTKNDFITKSAKLGDVKGLAD
ncbi:class II fructose-bisphosphate aldolase [Patescibacteria group bacterium]